MTYDDMHNNFASRIQARIDKKLQAMEDRNEITVNNSVTNIAHHCVLVLAKESTIAAALAKLLVDFHGQFTQQADLTIELITLFAKRFHEEIAIFRVIYEMEDKQADPLDIAAKATVMLLDSDEDYSKNGDHGQVEHQAFGMSSAPMDYKQVNDLIKKDIRDRIERKIRKAANAKALPLEGWEFDYELCQVEVLANTSNLLEAAKMLQEIKSVNPANTATPLDIMVELGTTKEWFKDEIAIFRDVYEMEDKQEDYALIIAKAKILLRKYDNKYLRKDGKAKINRRASS